MSWAEIKKALNSDLSTPLDVLLRNILSPMETNINKLGNATYGMEAIKVAVDSAKPWYAGYGTDVTLASISSAITVDNNTDPGTTLFSFVAPADGTYRIDLNYSITNNGTSSTNITTSLVVREDADMLLDGDTTLDMKADKSLSATMGVVNAGTTTTKSLQFSLYLYEGRRYIVSLKAGSTTSVHKMNSASVKYKKQYK